MVWAISRPLYAVSAGGIAAPSSTCSDADSIAVAATSPIATANLISKYPLDRLIESLMRQGLVQRRELSTRNIIGAQQPPKRSESSVRQRPPRLYRRAQRRQCRARRRIARSPAGR